MKKQILFLVFMLSSMLMINSCKKNDSDDAATSVGSAAVPTPDAKITGIVKSPNGQLIGSAKIISGAYSTVSDRFGAFTLDVYHGNNELIIQTGTGSLFKTMLNVNVNAGQLLSLPASQSVLLQVGTLAYIKGVYDEIEQIIIDSLGYSASEITIADLNNYTLLSGYNALFLNCGASSSIPLDSLKYTNLSTYLHNHGSIYASDFAVELLTGDGHWRPTAQQSLTHKRHSHTDAFSTLSTCMSPKLGGFISDSSLCTSKSGTAGFVSGAVINDSAIVNLLGHNTIDIDYDLGGWEVVNLYSAPMHPVITDNATNGALALKSDRMSNEYGGIIFYTTFHNEPQGIISPDVKNVLQYFILNL